jgi:translation initiation factor IF-2
VSTRSFSCGGCSKRRSSLPTPVRAFCRRVQRPPLAHSSPAPCTCPPKPAVPLSTSNPLTPGRAPAPGSLSHGLRGHKTACAETITAVPTRVTSPKQQRRRRPEISVLGGALGPAAVRDPCSPQRAIHSPQAAKCDHLGCPGSPSALRIPAATQRHTYVSAPGPRPAHGLETQERAGGHAVRRIQRPQTACRSPPRARRVSAHSAAARAAVLPTLLLGLYPAPRQRAAASHSRSRRATLRRRAAACPPQRAKPTSAAYLGGVLEGPARPWPMAHAKTRPAAPPSASATGLSAAPRWERLRDHGHGGRPSPTQTAPRGGRSRGYLVGGERSASHVPYPDLAGRHRDQAAIGATGVTGAAALNSLFYRSRVQPLSVTAQPQRRPGCLLHRASC